MDAGPRQDGAGRTEWGHLGAAWRCLQGSGEVGLSGGDFHGVLKVHAWRMEFTVQKERGPPSVVVPPPHRETDTPKAVPKIYTVEYHSAIKKSEVMPLVAA